MGISSEIKKVEIEIKNFVETIEGHLINLKENLISLDEKINFLKNNHENLLKRIEIIEGKFNN